MPFQVSASREAFSGPKPVPANQYDFQVVSFKPKVASKGDSLNYNAQLKIINQTFDQDKFLFVGLNTKFATQIRDFVHATGNKMESVMVPNEQTGEDEEHFVLPGIFENADQFPDDPTKWGKYIGPLTNATGRADVALTSYQGKDRNEVRAFFCTVPNCAVDEPDLKHSTNLIKG